MQGGEEAVENPPRIYLVLQGLIIEELYQSADLFYVDLSWLFFFFPNLCQFVCLFFTFSQMSEII